MTPEQRQFIQQKLKEFLSLSPEEKHAIDENPQYDGLFGIIQEMSDIVESSHEYKIFMEENTSASFLSNDINIKHSHGIVYSSNINNEEEYINCEFSQHIYIDTNIKHNYGIVYSSNINNEEEYTNCKFSQHIDEDYEYSWAA